MTTATATALIVMGLAVFLTPASTHLANAPGRLPLIAMCLLLPAFTLAAIIGRLAGHRFFTPEDINGSGLTHGTERARLLQAMLQNTLEQTALAIPAYLAWGLIVAERMLPALPAMAVLFLIGRVLFFRGYAHGAPSRAFGFALTFYSTVALIIGVVLMVVTGNSAETLLHSAGASN